MKARVPGVLSLLALGASLLALAQRGTAQPVSLLPPNSVGTAQLKKGAVTAAKIRPHSLLRGNFKAGQLPSGPPGLPGPVGPSNAFAVSVGGPLPVAVQKTPAPLAGLSLPEAGSYVITAKAWFAATGSGIATLVCTLDTLEGETDTIQLLAGNPTPALLTVAQDYPAAGTVELRCAARAAADAHDIRLTAIRVGALTKSAPSAATTP